MKIKLYEVDGIQFTEKQFIAAEMYEAALTGNVIAKSRFFEALATSDLPVALAPALNKKVMDVYQGIETPWTAYAEREILDDFRPTEVSKIGFNTEGIPVTSAGQTYVPGTLPRVPELGEYPVIGVTGSKITFQIFKSGAKFELSWERIVNNRDLRELPRATVRLARMARKTEAVAAAIQYVLPTGLNTTTLNLAGSANFLSGNPDLDFAALKLARAQASTHVVDGERVGNLGVMNLLVAPALEVPAREILAFTGVNPTVSSTEYVGPNPLAGLFDIVVVEEFAAYNNTVWGIAPKPGVIENGGAAVGFLRGAETPKFFIKNTTQQDPMEGSYDLDDISTKIRHTASPTWRGEPAGIVFSEGDNS